jgi:hypothetical protein
MREDSYLVLGGVRLGGEDGRLHLSIDDGRAEQMKVVEEQMMAGRCR